MILAFRRRLSARARRIDFGDGGIRRGSPRASVALFLVHQVQQRLAGGEALEVFDVQRLIAGISPSDRPAICGVISTLGNFQSGWPLGSGSGSVTSSPAPASFLLSSAFTNASMS